MNSLFFQLPCQCVSIRRSHQHAAAGNQFIGINSKKFTHFYSFLLHRYFFPVNFQTNTGAFCQLPEGSENSAFRHVMHGADSHSDRRCGFRQYRKILIKFLGFLDEMHGIAAGQFLFLLFGYDRRALQANPFADQNIISRLCPCSGYQLSFPGLPHAAHIYQRLIHCLCHLGMAAYNLHLALGAGLFNLPHNFFQLRLFGALRQQDSQHHSHWLRAGRSQIVHGDVNGKISDICGCTGNGIGRNHKYFILCQFQCGAVFPYAGSQQNFFPSGVYLSQYGTFQHALRNFSCFHSSNPLR